MKRRIKYKALDFGPKISSIEVDYVSFDAFMFEDDRIPLLVYNYRIYPDGFQDLNLMKGRRVAFLLKHYLSGREEEVFFPL